MIIAAPASGNGKTVFTLGLLRSLHRRGKTVAAFKIGPDYIDPGFHAATIGRPSFNLDCWAMRPSLLRAIANAALQTADYTVAEGVMGLFDGATANQGSTADVAAMLGWPILLIVDVGAQAASAAAVVRGFATHRTDIQIGAVIFNRVGGAGHAATLREACQGVGVAIAGMIPFDAQLALPERHLGLVLAGEHNDLDAFVDHAADLLESSIDMAAIESLARTAASRAVPAPPVASPVPPLGQRIAVAHDQAFAFAYPHLLSGWRAAGAEIIFFSPLADAPPDANADAVFLPGGYPELHAGRIAASRTFTAGLHNAARRGAIIYGECGGYMVLGDALTDAQGNSHRMAGLLPLSTSFAKPGLGFGYRR
ncbi:MAG: cobyrinate a,c-diamide synthase, partial [Proteobacteria bacterium]|nr:cobyrinate a,c-diamide synthase [Pseudomonadota bacterium]